jgi:hypothetical protein
MSIEQLAGPELLLGAGVRGGAEMTKRVTPSAPAGDDIVTIPVARHCARHVCENIPLLCLQATSSCPAAVVSTDTIPICITGIGSPAAQGLLLLQLFPGAEPGETERRAIGQFRFPEAATAQREATCCSNITATSCSRGTKIERWYSFESPAQGAGH